VERPSAVIFYHARPITTVFLAANTYCMMDSLSLVHLAPWAPAHVNRAINDWPAHAAVCHLLSVVQSSD